MCPAACSASQASQILTVEDARLEFTSVAEKTVVHGNDGKEVKWYKMFSRDVPSDVRYFSLST
jgi:hypothetical protein